MRLPRNSSFSVIKSALGLPDSCPARGLTELSEPAAEADGGQAADKDDGPVESVDDSDGATAGIETATSTDG
jgi:hypothetical protein